MKYDAKEFRRYADMLAPRAAPSILADMLRCAVDEAEGLREQLTASNKLVAWAVNSVPGIECSIAQNGEKFTITKTATHLP